MGIERVSCPFIVHPHNVIKYKVSAFVSLLDNLVIASFATYLRISLVNHGLSNPFTVFKPKIIQIILFVFIHIV